MLSFFHWGLLIGLGIILIAVLKADYNVRVIVVVGMLAAIVLYKLSKKR